MDAPGSSRPTEGPRGGWRRAQRTQFVGFKAIAWSWKSVTDPLCGYKWTLVGPLQRHTPTPRTHYNDLRAWHGLVPGYFAGRRLGAAK